MPVHLSRRHWLASASAGLAFAQKPARRNVLFLAVDDLRPELGCYGNRLVKTPNIDRLASRGVLFRRAYCQQAVCTPSRTSFLTGLRPDSTKVYLQVKDIEFRKQLPNVVTLPQHFRQNGYETRALGKIFGEGFNDPEAWSAPVWPDGIAGMEYVDMKKWTAKPEARPIPTLEWTKHESIQSPDVPDDAFQDGRVAGRAVAALREMRDRPFFLAVGFLKPHLPFAAPKKYFDLYPPDSIPMPPNPVPPDGVPPVALHDSVELRGYTDIGSNSITPEKTRDLIRAYYACTTYTDTQIGKVLDELDRQGLTEKTTVVLLGDHGWHLGEHSLWAKTTNFELDTRAPLIVAGAGVKAKGKASPALVEFVDVYPTLCGLCGLPEPKNLEGFSMKPLLESPGQKWKQAVFSQFPRPYRGKNPIQGMGYSMRTERYRYTEWRMDEKTDHAVELYDHSKDPRETVNVAAAPENHAIVAQMRKTLNAGWRAALPPGAAN